MRPTSHVPVTASKRLFRGALSIVCAAGVASPLFAGGESHALPTVPTRQVTNYLATTDPDLEGDLNCDEVHFRRAGLFAIVQNHADADAVRAAGMRTAGKLLADAVVFDGAGALSAALASGELAGIEFDWYFPTDGAPPTENRLDVDTAVYGTDELGSSFLIANVYGYDATQYALRKAAVEAAVGHPLRRFSVWAGDAFASGLRTLVSGDDNALFGVACTGGDFGVFGAGNAFDLGLRYGHDLVVGGGERGAPGGAHRRAGASPAALHRRAGSRSGPRFGDLRGR